MPIEYVHGYHPDEQDRLLKQARFLAPWIHANLLLPRKPFHGLEIGCGVGAQTPLLAKSFPRSKWTCVDHSPEQVAVAERRLKKLGARAQVLAADARNLPFARHSFDAAYCCWVLEHVPDPIAVLKEARRVLRPKAPFVSIEVFERSFWFDRPAPETRKAWAAFQEAQTRLGGDPNIGVRVPGLLAAAGFKNLRTEALVIQSPRNAQKRIAFFDYWKNLILSALPQAIQMKLVTPEDAEKMKNELDAMARAAPGSMTENHLTYVAMRTTAHA